MEGRATNGCQWVATVVVVRGSVAPNEGSVGFGVCVLPTMLPIAPECSPVEETVAGRGQPRKEPLCTWTVCTHTVLCVTATCCVHPYWTVCTHIVLCESLLDCVHPYCVVCTLTELCAPTFYFCAYGCSAVWSHIIFVKAHKANIVKANILTILGLLAVVHSRLCALCTFHNMNLI